LIGSCRTAIHNWVQKAELQPTGDATPDHIVIDETVIQVNDERRWLYAAVNPETNKFLHVRLFPTRTTQLTVPFLRELQQHVPVTQATILVDDAHHLKAAFRGSDSDFRCVATEIGMLSNVSPER